jgi:hypothetical protein
MTYDPYQQDPYYQQQPTTGYGGGYPPTRSTNTLAIVAMILALLGLMACGLLAGAGAICGHIALNQVRERNEEGEGFAKTGIIVGWIGVGLWVVGAIVYVLLIVLYGYFIFSTIPNTYPTTYPS